MYDGVLQFGLLSGLSSTLKLYSPNYVVYFPQSNTQYHYLIVLRMIHMKLKLNSVIYIAFSKHQWSTKITISFYFPATSCHFVKTALLHLPWQGTLCEPEVLNQFKRRFCVLVIPLCFQMMVGFRYFVHCQSSLCQQRGLQQHGTFQPDTLMCSHSGCLSTRKVATPFMLDLKPQSLDFIRWQKICSITPNATVRVTGTRQVCQWYFYFCRRNTNISLVCISVMFSFSRISILCIFIPHTFNTRFSLIYIQQCYHTTGEFSVQLQKNKTKQNLLTFK